MLKIDDTYKPETEEDFTDLLDSLLMVRGIVYAEKQAIKINPGIKEGYYEMQEALDAILMLIKPAMTYFSDEMLRKGKKRSVKKSA